MYLRRVWLDLQLKNIKRAAKTTNLCILLITQSIKNSGKFQANKDIHKDDEGSKWSLTGWCQHMKSLGHDMDKIWEDIYDVILKSLIAGEKHIVNAL